MSMKSMTSSFTKVCVYDRPHENAKTVFKKNCKSLVNIKSVTSPFTKVCVYDRPHGDVKTAFSKVSTLESVFECMRLG